MTENGFKLQRSGIFVARGEAPGIQISPVFSGARNQLCERIWLISPQWVYLSMLA